MRYPFESADYLVVIHALGPDNTDCPPHSLSQLVGGRHHAAVLHCLNRRLISNIYLNARVRLFRERFRILENIIRAAGINLKILLRLDPLGNSVNHVSDDSAVYSRLLL